MSVGTDLEPNASIFKRSILRPDCDESFSPAGGAVKQVYRKFAA